MKVCVSLLRWAAYWTAIGAVTVTPLLGFVVGDKRPSVAATALQMFIAVLLVLAALLLTLLEQHLRRSRRTAQLRGRQVRASHD